MSQLGQFAAWVPHTQLRSVAVRDAGAWGALRRTRCLFECFELSHSDMDLQGFANSYLAKPGFMEGDNQKGWHQTSVQGSALLQVWETMRTPWIEL